MESKLFKRIESIVKDPKYVRFHMPGHKGRSNDRIDWKKWDITEIPGSDNLNDPKDLLLDIMNEIAHIYQVKKSFILVNGSTVGIIASMLSACKPGDSFIIPRHSHKSVYTALLLRNINPIYIYESAKKDDYPIVNVGDVKRAFDDNPKSKGIIITSPSYHGICADISKISTICKAYKKILIVDEAHGAHLKFNKFFPDSSVDLGADVVIQSTHKTLNSLNQGALLHLCSSKLSIETLQKNISMLQTSSPSYPIMISIENAVKEAYLKGESKLKEIIEYYEYLEESILDTGFHLISSQLKKSRKIVDYDKSKLWIASDNIISKDLASILRERYSIQIEMWDNQGILGMMGMGTTKEDVERLSNALLEIDEEYRCKSNIQKEGIYDYPILEQAMNPWETNKYDQELVSIGDSKGRISSDFIIPYPPGIPIIVPGEIIDTMVINFLHDHKDKELIGLTKDGGIYVIK